MRRSLSSVAALLALSTSIPPPLPAHAQGNAAEQGGAAFLLMPLGGRATALGQATAADGGSTEAVFWNPAGLASLAQSEFAVHHATTFASDNTALTAFVVHDRLGVLGIAGYIVDFGSQQVIPRGQQVPTGRLSPKNIELLASYATTAAGPLAIGVTYKLIQFRQDCEGDCGTRRSVVGTTHAMDLGLQLGIGTVREFRIGIALRHAGFKLQLQNREQADPLPTRVQLGASYRIPLPSGGAPAPLDARLLVTLQDRWGEYTSPDARFGAEFGYGELLRVRAGYAFLEGETRGPSVGFGLRLDRVAIDFSRIFFASGTFDDPVYLSLRVLL